MRILIASLAAALCVGACSPQVENPAPAAAPAPQDAPLEPIPRDESAGRSGMDSMTWMFAPAGTYAPDRPAALLYSARASDETLIAMHCLGANVRMVLMRGEQAPLAYPFTLKSGDAQLRVEGAAQDVGPEPRSETRIEALAPTANPVFARMRETGEFALAETGEETPANAINDVERQSIRDFFAACA